MKSSSIFIYLCLTVLVSCSSNKKVVQVETSPDREIAWQQPEFYDAIQPKIDPSSHYEQFSEVIKRIQVTTYYTTYYFKENQRVTPAMLMYQKAEKLARQKHDFNHSKSGTAVALQQRNDKLILITCDHIVNVPDTIFVFESELKAGKNSPLKSITVLNRKDYFLFGAPRLNDFTVLAGNKDIDLALIMSEVPTDFYYTIPVVEIPLGDEKRLKWGSLVYSFGFPVGHKMMVNGMVSNPIEDASSTYTHNALFNRGLSGGMVIALRGDVPNFEWVGISNASSATTEYVLKPSQKLTFEQEERQVYTDTLFVERQIVINQGISKTIKPSVIRQFLRDNLSVIENEGFNLRSYTHKPS